MRKIITTLAAAAAFVGLAASPAAAVTMPVASTCSWSSVVSWDLSEWNGSGYSHFGELHRYESTGCNKTWVVVYVDKSYRWVAVDLNSSSGASSHREGTGDQVTAALALKNSSGTRYSFSMRVRNLDNDLVINF